MFHASPTTLEFDMTTNNATTTPPTEQAFDDSDICRMFSISKATLMRWRERHGFPKPDFYVGIRPFTWSHKPRAWAASMPSQSPIAGRSIPD